MGYEELDKQRAIQSIICKLDVKKNVASELYVLAGFNANLAIKCGRNSDNLTMCKARIVNERLKILERELK